MRISKKNRGGDPSLIKDCMSKALASLGVEDKFSACKVFDYWADIVGHEINSNTRPDSVHEGKLTVYVSSSAWLMELSRFYKNDILNKIKIKTKDDSVKDIIFKLDPQKR